MPLKSSEELLDIYSENLTHIGISPRSEVHKVGSLHQVIHVWVVSDKSIYFQQRSIKKKTRPLEYDITSTGHISSGEQAIESAIREVFEETGLNITENELFYAGSNRYVLETDTVMDNELANIFLCRKGINTFVKNSEVEKMIEVKISDYERYCKENFELSVNTIPTGDKPKEIFLISKNSLSRHTKEFEMFIKPHLDKLGFVGVNLFK